MKSRMYGKAYWMVAVGASLLMACEEEAAGSDTSGADTAQPDATEADTAQPDATGADTAQPDATEPDGSGELECALPQAPRDISVMGGINDSTIPGPGESAQWLCNVHFHDPLEHAGVGACPEVTFGGDPVCSPEEGDDEALSVEAGHIVEVHWVYSSCKPDSEPPPAPGLGLAPCACEGGQILRVRAQVYVIDDGAGLDSIESPPTEVALATYAGSTTGTKWDGKCSDVPVNWEVGTGCIQLRREALGAWCEDNDFGEHHGHGARELITEPASLSPYSPAQPE